MDLSYMECQGFRALGAMGSDKYANEPSKACRPFDKNRDGFIYGEACGAIVIERADHASNRQIKPYSAITGWGMAMDANRNPNPSYDGEVTVIKKVLKQANLQPKEIDYINPHGTGSGIGDTTELNAIRDCQLSHAYINATKSITGHALTAAGTIETIATILQMKESTLHPTKNLEDPMDDSFNWIKETPTPHKIQNALSLSLGFGGTNTAICIQAVE
jgi:malonyl-ACP decarboxylase